MLNDGNISKENKMPILLIFLALVLVAVIIDFVDKRITLIKSEEEKDWQAALGYLKQLKDNWDGEGAMAPSKTTLKKAEDIVYWALKNKLKVKYVDADVLGGAAVFLNDKRHQKLVWFSFLNEGSNSIVMTNHLTMMSKGISYNYANITEEMKQGVINFLKN